MIVTLDQRRELIWSRVQKDPRNAQKFKNQEIDGLYKIVMIGDSGTGKTSILLRFTDNIFNLNQITTIGVDFKIKTFKIDESLVKLQIWDTAGQERFKSISQAYYRNSHACIAVYDITKRASFDSLES